ncbi:MAG: hypothetical protein CMM94_05490 [Rickettsiales bacterium]|nr:hypothetical protein [Rickettsiales bacterium]
MAQDMMEDEVLQEEEMLQAHDNDEADYDEYDDHGATDLYIDDDSDVEALLDKPVTRQPSEYQLTAAELITLTARLAQVLAAEVDHLQEMKVSKIADLQKEKQLLVNALESVQKQIAREPAVIEEMTDEERDDLEQVIKVFNMVKEENHRRLRMARDVNQRVVETIKQVVADSNSSGVYTREGDTDHATAAELSVTLNEKV